MERIKLIWAEKFRYLIHTHEKYPVVIICEFLKFCDEKENELNEAWELQLAERENEKIQSR